MNYTTININGEDVGLKFGMVSDRYLAKKITNSFCFDGEDLTEIGIAHVIYSGYLNNCAKKDISAKITFEQLSDFIDENATNTEFVDQITAAVKLWAEVQASKRDGSDESKKKTTES